MISLLITLIIIALIAGVAWRALQQIPLPPPIRMVIVVVFALIVILALGVGLLPMGSGGPGFDWQGWR